MQLNGIGEEHTQASHQITNCIHRHVDKTNRAGGAGLNDTSAASVQTSRELSGQAMGLTGWLRSLAAGGRHLWGRVWGDSALPAEKQGNDALAGPHSGALGAALNAGNPNTKTTEVSELARAAAQSALVPPQNRENPYFTPIEQDIRDKNAWEKAKVKFQKIAKHLSRHLSGQDQFKKGSGHPPKDLSKRSQYREKDVQIDCILTDDSYLLDSYDRKGGYAKLSAKK